LGSVDTGGVVRFYNHTFKKWFPNSRNFSNNAELCQKCAAIKSFRRALAPHFWFEMCQRDSQTKALLCTENR